MKDLNLEKSEIKQYIIEKLPESSVKAEFLKLKSKFKSIKDYKCLYVIFSARGRENQLVKCRYYFKKPDSARMDIISRRFKNTVLLYRNNRVRVRSGTALLSMIVASFDPQNKLVCDLRGHGLNNSSWGWIIDEHLKILDLMHVVRTDDWTINGRPAVFYVLKSGNAAKTYSVAKELLWMDKKEDLLLKLMQYDSSGTLIQSLEYSDIVINSGLLDSVFTDFKQ